MKRRILSIVFFLGAYSLGYAQSVGDFVSTTSGNWSGSIWGTWDGTKATSTAQVPGPGSNVFISKSHTITLDKDVSLVNLTIAKEGELISDGVAVKRIFAGAGLGSKTASSIVNNGVLGGDNGKNLISIEVQNSIGNSGNGPFPDKSTFTISGTGKTNIAALVALGMGVKETKTKTLTIDINTPLNLTGENKHRTLTLIRLSGNSEYEDYTMNINSPVTLIGPLGSFNMGTSTTLTGGKYTYNLNSLLDFSASTISHGFIPLLNANSLIKLNVNKGGNYIMSPKLVLVNSAAPATGVGLVQMNIEDGGKVDAKKVSGLPSNAFIVKGTGILIK